MKKTIYLISALFLFILQSCEKNDIESDTLSAEETIEELKELQDSQAVRGLRQRERGRAE